MIKRTAGVPPAHGWERATPVALMGFVIHEEAPRSGALPAKTKTMSGPGGPRSP
jgi:hypothetical protein